MVENVNLVEAIRRSQWVRRRGWPDWMLASRRGPVLRVSSVKWSELTYADLVAEDWEPYVMTDTDDGQVHESEDPTVVRFRMMEIE